VLGDASLAGVPVRVHRGVILGARRGNAGFKAADGTFVTVNAAQMTGLYNGVVAHVQACYAAEAAAAAAINGGTITTYAGVDQQFAAIT